MQDFSINSIQPSGVSQVPPDKQQASLYSESVKQESEEVIDRFNSSTSWEDARKITYDTLSGILRKPNSTTIEKSLASIGIEVTKSRNDKAAVAIREIALKAIASQVPGPAGCVLSGVCLDIEKGSSDQFENNKRILDGLTAIYKSPDTSPQEKLFAKLGIDAGANVTVSSSSAPIRSAILNKINDGIQSPHITDLASTLLDITTNNNLYHSDSSRLLRMGFQSIKKDPTATDIERYLASFGFELASLCDSKTAVTISEIVMNAIASQAAGPVGRLLSGICLDTVKTSSDQFGNNQRILDGLTAIYKNPDTSPQEKLFAKLGIDAGANMTVSSSIAPIRSELLNKINDGIQSPHITDLASTLLDITNNNNLYHSDGSRLLRMGFQSIKNDPTATDTERYLASIGIISSEKLRNDKETWIVRKKIMETIISPGTDPERYTGAKVILEISNLPEIATSSSRNLLFDRLKALSLDPLSTENEKSIAKFGISIGKSARSNEEIKSQQKTLETLLSKPVGNISRTLSSLACTIAMMPESSPEFTRQLLFEACNIIQNDPFCGKKSKVLAQRSILINKNPRSYREDIQSCLKIMRNIHELEEKSFEEQKLDLENMLAAAKNPGSHDLDPDNPTVTHNSTSVDLGGVELKKRKKKY